MDSTRRTPTAGRGGGHHVGRVRSRVDRQPTRQRTTAEGAHPRALPRHPRTLVRAPARPANDVHHSPRHRTLVPHPTRRPDDAVARLLPAQVDLPNRGRAPTRQGVTRRRRGRNLPRHPEGHHLAHRRTGPGFGRRHAPASPTPRAARCLVRTPVRGTYRSTSPRHRPRGRHDHRRAGGRHRRWRTAHHHPEVERGTTDRLPAAASADDARHHLATHTRSGADDLVFPGTDGLLLTPGQVYGHAPRQRGRKGHHAGTGFYRARAEIGRPDFRFHDLRHFAATMAAISGPPPRNSCSSPATAISTSRCATRRP